MFVTKFPKHSGSTEDIDHGQIEEFGQIIDGLLRPLQAMPCSRTMPNIADCHGDNRTGPNDVGQGTAPHNDVLDNVLLDKAGIVAMVQREIRRRKLRAQLLGINPVFFSMPAWEILLELFLADLTGQRNKVTTVGLDSGIPQSTVQRWLAVLENLKLIQRRRDRIDKRRQWIGLSAKARQALYRYFMD